MMKTIRDMVIVFVPMIFVLGIVGYTESHYSTRGTIVEVDGMETTIEDRSGNLWIIENDNFKVGDNVEVNFFNNGTDYDRTDDEIIFVKSVDK